jgi:1-acyl-sn-glycerol-3-phosphate acyltransferase
VGELAGVRKGCVAVFGSLDPTAGTERLVVLAETHAASPAERAALQAAIARLALEVLGEAADEVVLAPPHTVLKTSSGKVRRSACRELYEAGRIGIRRHAAGWQIARLALAAAAGRARRGRVLAGEFAHAIRVGVLFALIAPLTWLVTAALPRPSWAWAVGRLAARVFLRLCGTPVCVEGVAHLPPPGQVHVLVANHASYVDGIVLAAALPRHVSFVAKRELVGQFIPRVYLRRLGVEFVERFDVRQGAADADRLAAAVAGGRSLAVFPEGTFTRVAGLRPFHMGAFAAAVRARVPVVPVVIRGSRGWLRADQWFPRHSRLEVFIGTPILPPADAADEFGAAVRLRDLARAEILQRCGEPEADPASS